MIEYKLKRKTIMLSSDLLNCLLVDETVNKSKVIYYSCIFINTVQIA